MSKVPISVRNVLLSKHKIFGRKEYKLAKSRLLKDEYIKDSVYGSYQGGNGLLVVTNKRVLVVDKRPFFDYIEDASHDQTSHLNYFNTGMTGTLHLRINKTFFKFRSYNESKLRNIYSLLQFELKKEKEVRPYRLSDIESVAEPRTRMIRPLRRRIRRHPGWNPHNPIMMGVIQRSGVSVTKE